MDIAIYKYGSRETFKPTILSFAEGVLIENDRLSYNDITNEGISYMRAIFDTDPDTQNAYLIKEDMLILRPEDLDDVQVITVDGSVLFIRNIETGKLDSAGDAYVKTALEKYQISLLLEQKATDDELNTDDFDIPSIPDNPNPEEYSYDPSVFDDDDEFI